MTAGRQHVLMSRQSVSISFLGNIKWTFVKTLRNIILADTSRCDGFSCRAAGNGRVDCLPRCTSALHHCIFNFVYFCELSVSGL